MASLQTGGELGDFLRSRRDRLTPEDVGIPPGHRRRTPGLRREEVAQLAGIGVDWYIRLEQGKATTPSVTTVDALIRALRLDAVESAHLRMLTQRSDRGAFKREIVPTSVREAVEALNVAAYVTGRRWDVLAWNQPAADLFAFDRIAEAERNTLVQILTNPRTRALFGDGWESEARRMVAQFRRSYDLWSHDTAFIELVEQLGEGCDQFARWWESHDLRDADAGEKRLIHPQKGSLRLRYSSYQANDNPDLKLVIYTSGGQ